MKLSRYDNKCVRIDCIDGKIYEGICEYDSRDYCYHEFGRDEEALEILHFLFYKCDIKKIKILKEFSEPYGEIEKETCQDMNLLEQALDSEEEDIHVYRILLCLEESKITSDIIKLLKNLVKYSSSDKIKEKANKLIERGLN